MPVTNEQLKTVKSTRTAGQGFTPEPQRDRVASPAPGAAPLATAKRVETVNSLAIANQQTVGELQSVLSGAIQAQRDVAKQTAAVVDALMSGEFLYQQINAELSNIQQTRAELNPQWASLTVEQLLPGADEVIRELNLLPGA